MSQSDFRCYEMQWEQKAFPLWFLTEFKAQPFSSFFFFHLILAMLASLFVMVVANGKAHTYIFHTFKSFQLLSVINTTTQLLIYAACLCTVPVALIHRQLHFLKRCCILPVLWEVPLGCQKTPSCTHTIPNLKGMRQQFFHRSICEV